MHRFLMQVALTQRTVEVEKMNTELKNRIAQLEREALERAEREIQAKQAKECHLELMLKQTLERVTQLESKKNETPKEPEVPKVAEKVPSKHAHAHVVDIVLLSQTVAACLVLRMKRMKMTTSPLPMVSVFL